MNEKEFELSLSPVTDYKIRCWRGACCVVGLLSRGQPVGTLTLSATEKMLMCDFVTQQSVPSCNVEGGRADNET